MKIILIQCSSWWNLINKGNTFKWISNINLERKTNKLSSSIRKSVSESDWDDNTELDTVYSGAESPTFLTKVLNLFSGCAGSTVSYDEKVSDESKNTEESDNE